MTHGHQSLLLATVGGDPMILRLEVLVFGTRRPMRRFDQRMSQPAATFARFAIAALARRLVVARAHARPRSQVFSSGKAAHVPTNFRQHHFGKLSTDARNRVEALYLQLKRAQPFSHLRVETLNGLLQIIYLA